MLQARYRRITWYFLRVLVSMVWWELLLPRIGMRELANRTRSRRLRRVAARFRVMAVDMGGVMIKVGQFLSSRVDVMPAEITRELEGLQDEVAAETYQDIRRLAEAELGATLGERYIAFDPEPMAAASLGQVHAAQVVVQAAPGDGSARGEGVLNVVVKVQRPNIEQIIATDLAALRRVGMWLRWYKPISKRADVPALLAEFSRTLYEEIDYLAEGGNAETFAANFKEEPGVLVPQVVWTHTTRRVLTLEDVRGIKITDYDRITEAGIERKEVAYRLISTYLKQIFEDGFFHADPHPGNLFVRLEPEGVEEQPGTTGWQLTFVDFGMVGHITPKAREGMRDMLIGIVTRDVDRLLDAYQKLGFLLPGADMELLKQAEKELFDRFWGKSMTELQQTDMGEMMQFAYRFRDLLYDLPFQIPQDIIFLGRAVGILSGMCTGLDPDFNVWDALAPYGKKMLANEGLRSLDALLEEIGKFARRLLAIPSRVERVMEKLEKGELATRDVKLTQQVARLESAVNQAAWSIVFAAFLVGAVQSYLAERLGAAIGLGIGASLALIGVARRRR